MSRPTLHFLLILAMLAYISGTAWAMTAITIRSPLEGEWTAINAGIAERTHPESTGYLWQPSSKHASSEVWQLIQPNENNSDTNPTYRQLTQHEDGWLSNHTGQIVGPERPLWHVLSGSWAQ